jgi:hypothetical protein
MKQYKQRRREQALARAELTSGMTPAQHIARLDARLGVGVGAARERAKWVKRMAK